jgi:hypothetical protein
MPDRLLELYLRSLREDHASGEAAALLPGELMTALDAYYAPLQTLAGFSDMASDSFDRDLRGMIQGARPDWQVAATRNPYMEQLEKFLHAQEHVPAEIEGYLARPWWGTPLLRVDRWARDRG